MSERLYQQQLVERIYAHWRSGVRGVLLQLSTGGGKTHLAAQIIAAATARGNRVIFAAHLSELVDDTAARLAACGVRAGIVQADRRRDDGAPVQVASIATLARRGYRPPASLLICDEAHRCAGDSWREVLAAYPHARILGLSATPARADDAPLSDLFDVIVCGPIMRELTRDGYLVPAVVLSPPQPMEGALAMDPVDAYVQHALGSRTLIFCATIDHARDVASRMPVETQLLLGETKRAERLSIRERLTSGSLRALVACSAPLEGFDAPPIESVILARALSTTTAYLQACGRGLRPSPATGKTHCVIIDLTGAAIVHGLPIDERVWTLTDGPRRTGEALMPLARCRGCLAVFHAGPSDCPRCGASLRGCRLKRRATRIERAELSRLDTTPEHIRDERAVAGILRSLRMRRPDWSEAKLANAAKFIHAKKKRVAA